MPSGPLVTAIDRKERHTLTHSLTYPLEPLGALSPRAEFVTIFLSLESFILPLLFLLFSSFFSHICFFSFSPFCIDYLSLVDLNVVIAISIRLLMITYLAPLSFFFHRCACVVRVCVCVYVAVGRARVHISSVRPSLFRTRQRRPKTDRLLAQESKKKTGTVSGVLFLRLESDG